MDLTRSSGIRPAGFREARVAVLGRPELTGAALRSRLSALADDVLTDLLGKAAGHASGVALVAVGSYGRREPAPGSDLHLLLLHNGAVTDLAAVADALWYPLWDSGVGLDHAVRTVTEARVVAAEDLKAALGLLDARHIAGDPQLTSELVQGAREDWRRRAPQRLREMLTAVRARAERWGQLAFLLEPDLREAAGGLRDVQAMYAAAAAWVIDPPSGSVRSAYELLLDVRGELHRSSGRGSDRLLLQDQEAVAAALRMTEADELLTAVSAAGRTISHAADHVWRRVGDWVAPPTRARRRSRPPTRRPLTAGVVEQGGEVMLARDADPNADPTLVLRAAAAAAEAGLPLAEHTVTRLAAESGPLPEPWSPAARAALITLLGSGPAAVPVIETLDQAGMMVRLLPEWASVRCRPQHNAVHRFTVDRHLVEAAAQAAALTRKVVRPDLLLLAALLHDLGKGRPGDHSEAGAIGVAAVAPRLGLPPEDVATLCRLTRYHLLLVDTATRRDLDDPATARMVADRVGNAETLDLLQALTEADARATGPGVWTEWKAGLVADLASRTRRLLAGEPPAAPGGAPLSARVLARRGVLAVTTAPGPLLTVTVAAPNQTGLFSAAAGVLALNRLNVRSATAHTLGDMAATTFSVDPGFRAPPPGERLTDDLRRALDGGIDIARRLRERELAYPPSRLPVAPPDVRLIDGAATGATVVDVRAHDRVGLLYRLTAALAGCGLDVRSALVATLGAEAVDAFYVTYRGQPLADPVLRAAVVAAVLAAVHGVETAAAGMSDDRPAGVPRAVGADSD